MMLAFSSHTEHVYSNVFHEVSSNISYCTRSYFQAVLQKLSSPVIHLLRWKLVCRFFPRGEPGPRDL